jgi:hypothetical protein
MHSKAPRKHYGKLLQEPTKENYTRGGGVFKLKVNSAQMSAMCVVHENLYVL